MAISVKKITLWRREMDDRPGTLAQVLAPVARAGTSLRVVMAYRYPEPAGKAAVELAPVTGRKATPAAQVPAVSPPPRSEPCSSKVTIGPGWGRPCPTPSASPGSTCTS